MTDQSAYNEGVKLIAQMLHNIAVACIVGGFLAPVFAANLSDSPNLAYLVTGPIGILLGILAATLGQLYLRTMYRS